MKIEANTVEEYINLIEPEKKPIVMKLRSEILTNIPDGFVEELNYGMIGYVVPHSIYPDGYHCNPKLPLPFMNIGTQKHFVAVYHMALYANETVKDWFEKEYKKLVPTKLDMGKSCIRLKPSAHIPYLLIGKLARKISVDEYIDMYENAIS